MRKEAKSEYSRNRERKVLETSLGLIDGHSKNT